MTTATDIRLADDNDHEWLYTLHELAHRALVEEAYGPWDDAQQSDFFAALITDYDAYVVESAGQPIGSLYLGTRDEDTFVALVEITPGQQGQGLGTSVLNWVAEYSQREGRGTVLQVHKLNPAAKRLYERLGYEPAGETETHFLLRRPAGLPA
ncbi:GNAT family N-acetyltransferase [Glaciihabitans sp. dw_435]|uniref:GNAT family N-acetyltransferase n=1 Tax=Glaciihabitans sp. dw_435 TaxID=2720081 RepID=UPI001BD6B8DA|nr:GNAT family N-acetyltransferase [Glaciihabitans sp. dw_435]